MTHPTKSFALSLPTSQSNYSRSIAKHKLHPENMSEVEKTELEVAVCMGDIKRVAELLDGGADIEARGSLGRSPLFLAASHNHPSIVTLLLSRGAKADAEDVEGRTPLQVAVLLWLAKVVEALVVPGGADVNAKDRTGSTQLHKAAVWNDLRIARILLANGADTEIPDAAGMRAQDYPRRSDAMVALLESYTQPKYDTAPEN